MELNSGCRGFIHLLMILYIAKIPCTKCDKWAEAWLWWCYKSPIVHSNFILNRSLIVPLSNRLVWRKVHMLDTITITNKIFTIKLSWSCSDFDAFTPNVENQPSFIGKQFLQSHSHRPTIDRQLWHFLTECRSLLTIWNKSSATAAQSHLCSQHKSCRKVPSNWPPSYIMTMKTILVISKMVGYFQDRPTIHYCYVFILFLYHNSWVRSVKIMYCNYHIN